METGKTRANSSVALLYLLRQSICEVLLAGGSVLPSRPHRHSSPPSAAQDGRLKLSSCLTSEDGEND